GIIKFDQDYGIAFKVETHNHPSALEPYGGAGTGIGGVIRDILGVGLGGKPILNTDIFCFGNLDTPYENLPEGVLHPRRIFRGVVSGVRDYGNRMGIPTGNGAIIFDEGYLHNCLVYCGTVGLIPLDKSEKEVKEGDLIVVVGGKTGRDGIHGATFSSTSLKKDIPTSVVQIGNPVIEKKMMDVLLVARDMSLYNSITDCGAGGLSSAVGEMGKDIGAVVYLDKVPLKYEGLAPWEIWLSESQERMVLSVPEKNVEKLLSLFKSEDVEGTVIGKFVKTGRLTLYYKGEVVCDIDMNFLHKGIPERKLKAFFEFGEEKEPEVKKRVDWKKAVLKVLSNPNVASKEEVITQYDHEVQARTVLKPITGIENRGVSDCVVLKVLYGKNSGIAVSCGINPFYGKTDPYKMAGCCIEEAIRNIVAVGGNPEKIFILDNFCWGNVSDEKQLGFLVRCVKGCRDFALKYKVPFISGKDSLNNYFRDKDGELKSIPGTLLISAVGIIEDVRKIVSSDFKKQNSLIFLCGKTYRELGGSQFCISFNIEGGKVPEPRPEKTLRMMKKLYRSIKRGIINACHDCSDGGFITALSEMAIGGNIGAEIFLDRIISEDNSIETLLFSESQGRFIVEVEEKNLEEFRKIMEGEDISLIGKTIKEKELRVLKGKKIIFKIPVKKLETAWRSGVKW
ncbi:MAG TPA: phosphoribosylformylglycinamidine synthase subunit PurL, partial [Firmicutes bacterium]|nr:phosphoribosylformylglycinamidine synthase subunit PurL [Bacillota bacterium]